MAGVDEEGINACFDGFPTLFTLPSTQLQHYPANGKTRRIVMPSKRKWSGKVKTVSTRPPSGLFMKSAPTIARAMASKRLSPKGIASGIRMIQFFINRAGKTLSATHRRELEKAKHLLQSRRKKAK